MRAVIIVLCLGALDVFAAPEPKDEKAYNVTLKMVKTGFIEMDVNEVCRAAGYVTPDELAASTASGVVDDSTSPSTTEYSTLNATESSVVTKTITDTEKGRGLTSTTKADDKSTTTGTSITDTPSTTESASATTTKHGASTEPATTVNTPTTSAGDGSSMTVELVASTVKNELTTTIYSGLSSTLNVSASTANGTSTESATTTNINSTTTTAFTTLTNSSDDVHNTTTFPTTSVTRAASNLSKIDESSATNSSTPSTLPVGETTSKTVLIKTLPSELTSTTPAISTLVDDKSSVSGYSIGENRTSSTTIPTTLAKGPETTSADISTTEEHTLSPKNTKDDIKKSDGTATTKYHAHVTTDKELTTMGIGTSTTEAETNLPSTTAKNEATSADKVTSEGGKKIDYGVLVYLAVSLLLAAIVIWISYMIYTRHQAKSYVLPPPAAEATPLNNITTT